MHSRLWTLVGVLLTVAMVVLSALINYSFGHSLGTTATNARIFGAVSMAAVGVMAVLPLRISAHWDEGCITAFANAFKRNKPEDTRSPAVRRHICIDEFASLGKLSAVETAVAVERGYAIQYHLYVQHFGQLENEYGRNWETFVANCAVQGFAINDVKTAEYLSKKCGVTTVETTSTSESKSTDTLQAMKVNTTRHQGQATSSRPLITPDEIMTLEPQLQLIFLQNTRPIVALKNDFRIYPAAFMGERLKDVLRLRSNKLTDAGEGAGDEQRLTDDFMQFRRRRPLLRTQVHEEEGRKALVVRLRTEGGRQRRSPIGESLGGIAKAIAMKLAAGVAGVVFLYFFWLLVLGWSFAR